MFRQMRRIRQQISQEECAEILRRATSGVLGLHGDDGYPYTVPVSFVYRPGGEGFGTIGFHCAKVGHKIDAIRRDPKVSFTVIDRDEVMPRERTTKFCSVIAFGRARIIEDDIFSIEDNRIRHDALKTAFLIFSYLMERQDHQ